MDPRQALISAMMSSPVQAGYQPISTNPQAAGVMSMAPMAKIAALAKLNTDNAMAMRGLPAAGSPQTPFSGMSTQPIPLQ